MISSSLKRISLVGNLYLIVYAVFAAIFYKERIFLDGSYYFFWVAQNETFHIEHQRYILAASQLLAVIGTKLNVSLNTLLILNSLNPIIYLWILFLLSVYWLKHEGIAWCLLLSSVCGIYFIYFIPMYEVWYGCVLLIFFAGILEKKIYLTLQQQIIFALLLVTLLFSYPLIFIGVIYFSVAHFLKEKKMPRMIVAIYFFSFAVWLLWKYFFISDYEEGKIEYPLSEEGSILSQNFTSAGNIWQWIVFLFRIYSEEMIALIIAVAILFRRKEKLQAALLIATFVGFLLLISFFHVHPWTHTNYFERMYLLLIPLCLVPFFQNVYTQIKMKTAVALIAVALIFLRGNQIIAHASDYRTHVNELESLITKCNQEQGSKFTVDFSKHPELSSLDEWSLPMEALIFSSLNSNQHSVTISWKADVEIPDISKRLDENKFRLRLDEIYPDDWLNKKYFNLQPGNYSELIY
ncbi:MAG: hypothetical protein ACHQD9_07720 [Chitinophagales bacterium]